MLSDDKVSHLSHVILTSLKRTSGATLVGDDAKVLRLIKRVLASELEQEAAIDRTVRQRLASYARPLVEGTQEWEVLYRKFSEEELRRRVGAR
jgi:hypothetical protein